MATICYVTAYSSKDTLLPFFDTKDCDKAEKI